MYQRGQTSSRRNDGKHRRPNGSEPQALFHVVRAASLSRAAVATRGGDWGLGSGGPATTRGPCHHPTPSSSARLSPTAPPEHEGLGSAILPRAQAGEDGQIWQTARLTSTEGNRKLSSSLTFQVCWLERDSKLGKMCSPSLTYILLKTGRRTCPKKVTWLTSFCPRVNVEFLRKWQGKGPLCP